jgi:hypothetical protein
MHFLQIVWNQLPKVNDMDINGIGFIDILHQAQDTKFASNIDLNDIIKC